MFDVNRWGRPICESKCARALNTVAIHQKLNVCMCCGKYYKAELNEWKSQKQEQNVKSESDTEDESQEYYHLWHDGAFAHKMDQLLIDCPYRLKGKFTSPSKWFIYKDMKNNYEISELHLNHLHQSSSNWILASTNIDIIRYLQPALLILLHGYDEMQLMQNPNDLDDIKSSFDVKAVLDLPQFHKKKKDREKEQGVNDYQSIQKLMEFPDLILSKSIISVNNEVRELKCKVIMDKVASDTSRILDVEDFNG